MNFFKILPKIKYHNIDVRNLFYKYYFIELIDDKYLSVYNITEGDTLQSISYSIYGDTELWWVIAYLNNINDIIFDLPVSQKALQEMARDQSTINDELDMTMFSSIYDKLEIENDKKRKIKIIKLEYLNKFLSDVIRKFNENN